MGKSSACLNLLYRLQGEFPVICVCSGSEADNPFYSKYIPKIFCHQRLTKKMLKQYINRQRLCLANEGHLTDSLLILDDCFNPYLWFFFFTSHMANHTREPQLQPLCL